MFKICSCGEKAWLCQEKGIFYWRCESCEKEEIYNPTMEAKNEERTGSETL